MTKNPQIRPGWSYILKEKLENRLPLFKKLFSSGFKGLCITKHNPKDLRKKYDLDIIFFQLSPKSLVEIVDRIEKFVESTKKGIVLFEGIDKIIEENNFLDTLNLLEDINDRVMPSSSSLVVALDTSKLNRKEIAFLERNLEIIK